MSRGVRKILGYTYIQDRRSITCAQVARAFPDMRTTAHHSKVQDRIHSHSLLQSSRSSKEGEVEFFEEPMAGTPGDQRGAMDTGKLGEVVEPPPKDGEAKGDEEPLPEASPDQVEAMDTGELDEPEEILPLVPSIFMGFEVGAKTIDMGLLKNCIWNLLTENTPKGEDFPRTTLRSIFSKLPTKLPKDMHSSLNIPLVFSSILMLAGEKHLTLEQKENLEDVVILGKNRN